MMSIIQPEEITIGMIIAVHGGLAGTVPSQFALCDGSTISDSESPLDGQTLPDLNGQNRYLRGNTTSGGTGGTNSSHNHTYGTWPTDGGGSGGSVGTPAADLDYVAATVQPPYFEVQWYMRIK